MKKSSQQVIYIIGLLFCGVKLQSSMAAVTGSQSFAVNAKITAGCEFMGEIKPLKFPDISISAPQDEQATSEIKFRCNVSSPKISLDAGLHPDGKTPQLYNSRLQKAIPYTLTLGKDTVTNQAYHTVTVTADLKQNDMLLYPGHYSDTVTVTVIY